jgi:hypothetical protein
MNICNSFNYRNETRSNDTTNIENINKHLEDDEEEFIKKNKAVFLKNYDLFKQYRHLYTNEQITNNICYIHENNVIIQYAFFKQFGNKNNYDIITQHIVNSINSILINYDSINVHFSLHKMDLLDLEKHYDFLLCICKLMQSAYPDKLNKFNIYQPPFIYSKIYSIISTFIDKTTRSRIKLVE